MQSPVRHADAVASVTAVFLLRMKGGCAAVWAAG
jgi:hypothetical protein